MEYGRGYVVSSDKIYPSITTILGTASDHSGLDKWRADIGEEKAELISRRATTKGTAVHEMAEYYLKNELKDISKYDFVARESFLRLKPLLDIHISDIVAQEVPLYSHRLKIAGRVDLIAHFDGILSIIDFKTANRSKEKEWIKNYFIQETAYAAMFFEMTEQTIYQLVTIITVEHDDPQIFIEQPKNHFKNLIELRQKFKELKGI